MPLHAVLSQDNRSLRAEYFLLFGEFESKSNDQSLTAMFGSFHSVQVHFTPSELSESVKNEMS